MMLVNSFWGEFYFVLKVFVECFGYGFVIGCSVVGLCD